MMNQQPLGSSVQDLLLPPRAQARARLCTCGDSSAGSAAPGALILPSQTGDPSTFGTLAAVLSLLRPYAKASQQAKTLDDIAARVERLRAAERVLDTHRTLDEAVMASRGALAALRRVTRESAEIAIVTDRAARILASILRDSDVRSVVVPHLGEIDRPSLKALFRACLIARPDSAVVWEWHMAAMPAGLCAWGSATPMREVVNAVRAELLETVLTALRLTPRPLSGDCCTNRNGEGTGFARHGVGVACNWLTTQNYDAAIRWAADTLVHEQDVDALRILAVAATNVGRHDLAIQAFRDAYHASSRPTLRAHLCAMQALVIAKRKFELTESQRWYEQGLAELGRGDASDGGDPSVEKAWIFNGLALNQLLQARFSGRPIGTAFDSTFDLLVRAFDLVKHGSSSDCVYLRYNLLGNMSAFMSLQGEYRVAQDLFERAFDPALTEGLADALEWRAVLTTRRAGLYATAGDNERALALYREAVDLLVDTDRPICAETVRRSAGILSLRLGRTQEAAVTFREGLTEALEARSQLGAKIHGAGLVHALVREGRTVAAADALRALGETEGVWLADAAAEPTTAALSVAPPTRLFGLSTSIPEVDLETIEAVNISGVLSGAQTVARPSTWSS